MTIRINWRAIFLCVFTLSFVVLVSGEVAQAKTYQVTPNSKPLIKTKNSNQHTKHYYLLKGYLERIEKEGGGKLILKKGTYKISNNLYIPSNTTLELKDGTKVQKYNQTGKANFKASKSLFLLVPSQTVKKGKQVNGYAGSKNITIKGYGSATIDLGKIEKAQGIVSAHTNNVRITGIQFRNNHKGTFIHIIGSTKQNIENNHFLYATKQTTTPAIRLESAMKHAAVLNYAWIKHDQVTNQYVTISNNQFDSQYMAVRTSTYNKKAHQTGIIIESNQLKRMNNTSLYLVGWTNPIIDHNQFDDTMGKANATIELRAVQTPVIRKNMFIRSNQMVAFRTLSESLQLGLSAAKNTFTLDNKRDLLTNKARQVKQNIIILPSGSYNQTGNKAEIMDEAEFQKDVYHVNHDTKPLNRTYELRPSYTSMTKDYYVLRSIFEQLEKQDGGTVYIEKGTYMLTNTLFIPSNVTVELEDGVILKKALETDATTMPLSNSIFQLVPPSKANKKASVREYDGSQNIKVYSQGRATIDLQHKYFSFGVIMAHTNNVVFKNIDFRNMNSGHFIELDASQDVLIDACTFEDSTPSENMVKEAINIDTPDRATKGFNSEWSSFDRTPVNRVTIQDSTFKNIDRAIGTHKYSGEGIIKGVHYESKPHKGIVIQNNIFMDIRNDVIRAMNWDGPIISQNYFKNIAVGQSGKRGILSSGSYAPRYEHNTFENVGRSMQFLPWRNNVNAEEYEIIYDRLDEEAIRALETNIGKDLDEYFIRISDQYLVYTNPKKVTIIKQ